jgi:hypothetical protein
MPNSLLNQVNGTNFLSWTVVGAIFAECMTLAVVDFDDHQTPWNIRKVSASIIVGAYCLVASLKFRQHLTHVFNYHTFQAKIPVDEIDPGNLIVLDHYAFDVNELIAYAKNDISKIYKNPHRSGDFSNQAKTLLKKHDTLGQYANRLERHLATQKKLISTDVIVKMVVMLEKIDLAINEKIVEAVPDRPESPDLNQIEAVFRLISNWHDGDPLEEKVPQEEEVEEEEDVDIDEDLFEDLSDSRNLSNACDQAHLEFIVYLSTLSKNKRKTLNDYIIEVPFVAGGHQRLKFEAALTGGNDFEPCVTTMQIFLWQMVVTFKPALISSLPPSVKEAANRFHLEIRSANYRTTIMGDVLKLTSHSSRFFNAAMLRNPPEEVEEMIPSLMNLGTR